MNANYLADALDHWKGSMIRRLREVLPAPGLRGPAVVPLLTDASLWTEAHLATYAEHLQVPVANILGKGRAFGGFSRRRREYFDEILSELVETGSLADIFLDPDKGIETANSCEKERVAIGHEIARLAVEDRLVLVYEQTRSYRMDFRAHTADLRQRLGKHGLYSVFWTGRQVAMVVSSRNSTRVAAVRSHWEVLVNPRRSVF